MDNKVLSGLNGSTFVGLEQIKSTELLIKMWLMEMVVEDQATLTLHT